MASVCRRGVSVLAERAELGLETMTPLPPPLVSLTEVQVVFIGNFQSSPHPATWHDPDRASRAPGSPLLREGQTRPDWPSPGGDVGTGLDLEKQPAELFLV